MLFEQSPVDYGQSLDRDKETGVRWHPRLSVRGESSARDQIMNVWMVVQLPAPGVQDAGEAGQMSAYVFMITSKTFEGLGRCREHGAVAHVLMTAYKGAELFRDGESDHEVMPGKHSFMLFLQPVL